MEITTGIVLAAGEGTRLRPLTANRPNAMLPAAGRPILEHVLDALVDNGIESVHLVVGYRRERIQEHFGHSYRGVPLTYVLQEKQLGSGHALGCAREGVEGPAIVLNGDRIVDESVVRDVLAGFDGGPALAVLEHPQPTRYGAVRVDDGRLTELVEKPDDDGFRFINAGVYALGPSVFDAIDRTPSRGGELQVPDVLGTMMDDGAVRAIRTDGLWVDATYPWDLLALTRELLVDGRSPVPESGAGSGVRVAESARVHPDATLQAPIVVGADTEVGAGAVLGPNVAVGRNVTVGANATLRDAVVDGDCRIDAGVTALDTVLGERVSVGAGTVVPGGPGDVRVGDTVYEGQPLGAVVADRTSVGGGVTFAPGTLVGANVKLGAGVHADGTIADGTEVVR